MNKICKKCGREFPLSEEYFYTNKQLKDGFENTCKECRGSRFGKYANFIAKKEGHKVCTICRKEFPANTEYFYRNNRSKDKLNSNCIECAKIQNNSSYNPEKKNQYYLANKDEILEQSKKHYIENKDSIIAYCKKRYSGKREELLEYQRLYRIEKAEEISKQRKGYYNNNKELHSTRAKVYRNKNKNVLSQKNKQWREHNKSYLKEYARKYRNSPNGRAIRKVNEEKRRALKRNSLTNLTAKQWLECKDYFRDKEGILHCAYCDKPTKRATMDHFIPLSKYGINTKDNILPVCRSCNSKKYNFDFFEWYPKQEFYSEVRQEKILEYLGYNDIQQLSIL